ncbi:MAG: PHP domain-containing protein [Synergistaceae bacterium]|nr:PHP domain-containing protein [Synergistaceae bacterium]
MRADLHIHSNASDGTDSPAELLEKIIESGINIFALTDHDTINGALEIMTPLNPVGSMTPLNPPLSGEDLNATSCSAPCQGGGREGVLTNNQGGEVVFIKGIEFSCITANHHKCHILGLNYDEDNHDFQEALNIGDKLRHEKFYRRIDLLREKFAIEFTEDEISSLLSIPSVGKPHIAKLLIQKGLAATITEAIERYINPCRTQGSRISAEMAVNAINSSGGIAVWAHPLGGEGERELSQDEFTQTLGELLSYGIMGLECFYSKYELAKCEWLEEVAVREKLFISGGRDYHGRNKNITLGRLNAENIYIDANRLSILGILGILS